MDPLKMASSFETDLCELVTYTTAINDDDNDWDYDFENDTGEPPMILLADGTPVLADEHLMDQHPNTASDSSHLSVIPLSNLLNPSLESSIEHQHPMMQLSASLWKKPILDDCVGALSCSQCSYTCDDQTSLRQHQAEHSTSTTLHCVYCSYKTISETHFARHITDHEIEKAALERGEELGNDLVFDSVSDPLQQTRLQSEEDDDWQIGCPPIDILASASMPCGINTADHSVDDTRDFLPTIEGQQTASVSTKLGSASLKRNVSGAVHIARSTSKRKNASQEEASPSSHPLSDSHSRNPITNGLGLYNTNDTMENTKGTSAMKRVKITDCFGAMSCKNRPEQPSTIKSLRKTNGKWRCPHCPYSSKKKFVVEKHISSHDLDNGSNENNFEKLSFNEALLQPKEELPDHCHCDNDDYRKEKDSSVDPLASPELSTLNCNTVSESPLQTYLSKNRLDTSGRDLFSFNSHNQENQFENITLLNCPFCTVRSRNQIAHENHITLCHIEEKDALDGKNKNISLASSNQASSSSTRVSNRPSTSRYKKPSLQVTGSTKDGRNKSDFVMLFDSDSDDSDHDFKGFHPNIVEGKLAHRSLRNLTHKELYVPTSLCNTSPQYMKSQRQVPKLQSTKRQDLILASSLAKSRSKHSSLQPKTNLNVAKPSTEQGRVGDHRVDCSYVCPLCMFSTIVRLQFLNHINTVHSPGEVFVCRTCSLSSTNLSTIENHKKQKCPNTSLNFAFHLCPNCPFQSIYYKSYERHVLNCSRVLTEEGYHRDGKHMCPFCHYRSSDIEAYKEHLLNHVRSDALSCPKCPFKTSRKDMYRWHLKMEHNFVPGTFRCKPCDFSSINYQQYFTHMASHFPMRRKFPRLPLPHSIAVVMHQQLVDHMTRERGLRDTYQTDEYGAAPLTLPPLKYASSSPKKKSKSTLPKEKIYSLNSEEKYTYSIKTTLSKKTATRKRAPFVPSVLSATSNYNDASVRGSTKIAGNASHQPLVITTTSDHTRMTKKISSTPKHKSGKISTTGNSTSPEESSSASYMKTVPKKRGRPRKIIPFIEDVPDPIHLPATSFDHFLHPAPALSIESVSRRRGRPKIKVSSSNDVPFHGFPSTTALDKILVRSPVVKSAAAKQPPPVPTTKQVVDSAQGLVSSLKTTSVDDGAHSRLDYGAIPGKNSSPPSPARPLTPPQAAAVAAAQPSPVRSEIVAQPRASNAGKTPVCAASSFVCPFCSQVFNSNTQLVRHVAVHTDRGRMTCPICNFSTMEFPALQGHLRSLHQELCF